MVPTTQDYLTQGLTAKAETVLRMIRKEMAPSHRDAVPVSSSAMFLSRPNKVMGFLHLTGVDQVLSRDS